MCYIVCCFIQTVPVELTCVILFVILYRLYQWSSRVLYCLLFYADCTSGAHVCLAEMSALYMMHMVPGGVVSGLDQSEILDQICA